VAGMLLTVKPDDPGGRSSSLFPISGDDSFNLGGMAEDSSAPGEGLDFIHAPAQLGEGIGPQVEIIHIGTEKAHAGPFEDDFQLPPFVPPGEGFFSSCR